MDFLEILYLSIFRKAVLKIQVSLKSDKNNGYFTRRPIDIFLSYLIQFFVEWEMFQPKVVEEITTHILCSITFFFNRAVYEIIWKNIVERGRPQMTIWCMHIACWITKATCTLTICNTYCFSTATTVAKMCREVTLYVHCLSCLVLDSVHVFQKWACGRGTHYIVSGGCLEEVFECTVATIYIYMYKPKIKGTICGLAWCLCETFLAVGIIMLLCLSISPK